MNTTTRSASGTAIGFSSTALTTEKIAVLAPMPSVSAATAARVKAGLCANMRSDCLRSRRKDSILDLRRGPLLFCWQFRQGRSGPDGESAGRPRVDERLRPRALDQRPDGAAEARAEIARGERAGFARRRCQRDGFGNLILQEMLGVGLRIVGDPPELCRVLPLEGAHRLRH